MKKLLTLLMLLSIILLASTEAILKLDTQGHTSTITKILITKNKDIISSSTDKTIRIWDSELGKEKRKILGEIDNSSGNILSIALSPDEKYLAVGTFSTMGKTPVTSCAIKIYEYSTGKLEKVLESHVHVVLSLAFSENSRYLISGSADRTAKIWDMNSFTLIDTIETPSKSIPIVKIIQKNNKNFVILEKEKNTIILYNIKKKKIVKTFKLQYNKRALAISQNHIAVSIEGAKILIFDYDLNHIDTIKTSNEVNSIAYSPHGHYLICDILPSQHNIEILDVEKKYKLFSKFTIPSSTTIEVAFLDEKIAIAAGGTSASLYLLDISTGKIKKTLTGSGMPFFKVNIKENIINAIGETCINENCLTLKKDFNLKDFNYLLGKVNIFIDKPPIQNKKYQLTYIETANKLLIYNIKTNKYTSVLLQAGNICYGIYNEFIIIGNPIGIIEIYNSKGILLATLDGHTGRITDFAVHNNKLISSSEDQLINIWDLSNMKIDSSYIKVQINKVLSNSLAEKYGLKKEDIIYKINNVKFKNIDNFFEFIQPLATYDFYILREKRKKKITVVKNEKSFGFSFSNATNIDPQLTLFMSKDNEWVAYTKEGFFDASKKGAQYIGYHINQGPDKEAKYLSVDKFYNSFYRPDLVQKSLNGEDISSYAKDINIEELISGGLPPSVAIKTKSHISKKKDINLKLELCKDSGGYDNLTLLLNGSPIDVTNGTRAIARATHKKDNCFHFNKPITLMDGENLIGFKATTKNGNIDSNTAEIKVTYKSNQIIKPNLHLLTIAVDKYRDGDLWLKYSNADAKGLEDALTSNAKELFENINIYRLSDKDVTSEKIMQKFKEIGSKTSREDVFVLYVAGHGITDKKTGAYFYLPANFRYKNESSVRESGFSQNDFKLALSKIQAMKTLVMLDTCNSGSFAESMASRGMLQKGAITKLVRATGRATIVASSKDQVALEGYKGHGVFTYTLIEALKGKGYGTDSKITIKELSAYVEDRVPDLTYEKWGYEQVPQANISGRDFPIGVR